MDSILARFLRYVKINTQSDPGVLDCPSTKEQLELAELLKTELIEFGLEDVLLDQNGYVKTLNLKSISIREEESLLIRTDYIILILNLFQS